MQVTVPVRYTSCPYKEGCLWPRRCVALVDGWGHDCRVKAAELEPRVRCASRLLRVLACSALQRIRGICSHLDLFRCPAKAGIWGPQEVRSLVDCPNYPPAYLTMSNDVAECASPVHRGSCVLQSAAEDGTSASAGAPGCKPGGEHVRGGKEASEAGMGESASAVPHVEQRLLFIGTPSVHCVRRPQPSQGIVQEQAQGLVGILRGNDRPVLPADRSLLPSTTPVFLPPPPRQPTLHLKSPFLPPVLLRLVASIGYHTV